ncbi:MAG TPA: TOPRIM nucleotidyl transferase/hydrolase domain-containing protein [Kofleriaceae bacterium]|nr:TOPRIM nucleotidyl transferase/hydrolase domain-containing protein [Kofleriaceae bacterium]
MDPALERALIAGDRPRAVVLVEGVSDQRAVEALARRRGRDLAGERVVVAALGGATAIGQLLELLGPHGRGLRLAGLCDAGEESRFRRALEQAGLATDLDRAGMEALGFHVCDADLEDELIRSLGPARVEAVVEAEGELAAFRTFQAQPGWQGRSPEAQLRRFLGTRGGRKIQYARLLVEVLDLDRVPRPLDQLLAHL